MVIRAKLRGLSLMLKILTAKRNILGEKKFSNRESFCVLQKPDAVFGGVKVRERMAGEKGSVKINFMGIFFSFIFIVSLLGGIYLYQVNDLVGKGYEFKEIENKLEKLKKENEQEKMKEVELRSMRNIEKSIENLNLVSSNEVSFLEINGPVAMK